MIKKFENFQIDLNISYELYRLDNVGNEEVFILSNDDLNSNVYDLNDMYKLLKKYQKADKTVFLKKITTENLYPNDLDIIMKSNKYNL